MKLVINPIDGKIKEAFRDMTSKMGSIEPPMYVLNYGKNGFVSLELKPTSDGIRLSYITVPEQYRGKGLASHALKYLTDIADKYGVNLTLGVSPQGKGLTTKQLTKWYNRHGFTGVPQMVGEMMRKPISNSKILAGSLIGPVYHASHGDFIPRKGVMFFSDKPRIKEFGKVVTEAYLNMGNRFLVTEDDIDLVLSEMPQREIDRMMQVVGVKSEDDLKRVIVDNDTLAWQEKPFIDYIKIAGFDSVEASDSFGGTKEYAVFNPSQIKVKEGRLANMVKNICAGFKLLEFPENRQTYNYDCGANSLLSVLQYYGCDFLEDEIIERSHTTEEDGISNEDLCKAIESYGLKFEARDNMTIDEVKRHIDDLHPVILDIQAYPENPEDDVALSVDDGHYVVAIGYNGDTIIFEDPSSSNRTSLESSELIRRWHDEGVCRWGAAIFGTPVYKKDNIVPLPEFESRVASIVEEVVDKYPRLEKINTVKSLDGNSDIDVWYVDGEYIRNNLNEEFTNFAQHETFNFVPDNEFWIDQESNRDECEFFTEHLRHENKLMKDGMSYYDALDEANKVEMQMRQDRGDLNKMIDPRRKLVDPKRAKIRLLKGLEDGVGVWLVDGRLVRSALNIDFTQGGHEYVYEFVPEGEVWIDNDVAWHERAYVILHELHERNKMIEGWSYNKAHEDSSALELSCRKNPAILHVKLLAEGW